MIFWIIFVELYSFLKSLHQEGDTLLISNETLLTTQKINEMRFCKCAFYT